VTLAIRDVPHDPRSAAAVRRELSRELGARSVSADLTDDVEILVSELVGNAVRYANPLPGGVLRIAWELARNDEGHEVTLRVTDGGAIDTAGFPHQMDAPLDSETGRGLRIVATLASDWGVDLEAPGQSVWAVLRRKSTPLEVA